MNESKEEFAEEHTRSPSGAGAAQKLFSEHVPCLGGFAIPCLPTRCLSLVSGILTSDLKALRASHRISVFRVFADLSRANRGDLQDVQAALPVRISVVVLEELFGALYVSCKVA